MHKSTQVREPDPTIPNTRPPTSRPLYCAPCCRTDGQPRSDFTGWLGGDPGLEWAQCSGCGWHLLDDAGNPACGGQPAPTGSGCLHCLTLAGEGDRS